MTLFSRFGTFTAGIVAWAVTAPVVFAAGEWPQDNGRPGNGNGNGWGNGWGNGGGNGNGNGGSQTVPEIDVSAGMLALAAVAAALLLAWELRRRRMA
ncbi:VPEID-CTERM sorting domain-containing protein [Phaeobacter italicus]|uniref:VPEID-CTERM sorting domain-containing protein n=1 Tax=Phaeobacter italicus TaxID=481446 RepID=UPI001ADD5E76|nr:VPEID-CTERM sorting domain-containing protein [Phaeobacter italicus]MBO9442414.1 VPEID-CTERM sorting domain-containing protein [Phaeobacter italicus]